MEYSESDLVFFVDNFEKELIQAEKIKFSFNRNWSSNFPSKQVYMQYLMTIS